MAISTKGISPDKLWGQKKTQVIVAINSNLYQLERELIQASPVGVAGQLRTGWTVLPAIDEDNPVGILGNSQNYFLPLELGRRPGKGISAAGQKSVALWAKRVMGIDGKQADQFAFNLSKKYKAEGRKAAGFAGLAVPGSAARQPSADGNIQPVPGGLIDRQFKQLDQDLDSI